jgi:hypothetical protein
MLRITGWLLLIIIACAALAACPKQSEDNGSAVEKGSPRPKGKKLRLELKLKPSVTYQSMLHTSVDARIVIEGLDDKGKPVTSTMTSTNMSNFHRSITDGAVKDKVLTREVKTIGGIVDKTQSEAGNAVRRMLILEAGKFRVTELGKPAKATAEEESLGAALVEPRELLVAKDGKIERSGEVWSKLAKAQMSPVFPYIDTERLTELAQELPSEGVRVGDSWSRTGQLQVGDSMLNVEMTSTLQQVSDTGGNNTAQIVVQLQGNSDKPVKLSGKSDGYDISTTVDSLAVSGAVSFVLDLKKGRVQNLKGDIQISFGINTSLDKGGKVQKLRVRVDNAKLSVTEDMLYDMPNGKPQA